MISQKPYIQVWTSKNILLNQNPQKLTKTFTFSGSSQLVHIVLTNPGSEVIQDLHFGIVCRKFKKHKKLKFRSMVGFSIGSENPIVISGCQRDRLRFPPYKYVGRHVCVISNNQCASIQNTKLSAMKDKNRKAVCNLYEVDAIQLKY